jgi:hypothetical protein
MTIGFISPATAVEAEPKASSHRRPISKAQRATRDGELRDGCHTHPLQKRTNEHPLFLYTAGLRRGYEVPALFYRKFKGGSPDVGSFSYFGPTEHTDFRDFRKAKYTGRQRRGQASL